MMYTGMALDDEALMNEVRTGDVGRLELLFDRHHPGLVRYFLYLTGNRPASEDLLLASSLTDVSKSPTNVRAPQSTIRHNINGTQYARCP